MHPLLPFFVLAAAGCVATPIPDPPSFDRITSTPTSVGPSVELAGAAGSVEPSVRVVAVNLDRTEAPVSALADASGAFLLEVRSSPIDVLRLHVESGGARSGPVDIIPGSGTPSPAPSPLEPCLQIPLSVSLGEIGLGSTRTQSIQVTNDCGQPVQVGSLALRAPAAGLSVRSAAPLVLPMGPSALEVDVMGASAGPLEEVLLIGIDAPETGRRAITLYGNVR